TPSRRSSSAPTSPSLSGSSRSARPRRWCSPGRPRPRRTASSFGPSRAERSRASRCGSDATLRPRRRTASAMSEQQRYRVLKRLASGGMAEVFVAESAGIEGFKKQVAFKRVLPQLSKKEQFIAMFLDEARLSAHLSHSNVVSVFDIGVGDGSYFIVMEYVDGADLKAVMEHNKKTGGIMP